MPQFGSLKVEAWSDGTALPEYGTRRLGRTRTISTWIESKTDQAFYILIQPRLPWDYTESGPIVDDDGLDSRRSQRVATQSANAPDEPHPYTKSSSPQTDRFLSPSLRYSLVAEIFLDGRSTPERRSVIYLDPHHPEAPKDCRLWVKHRWSKTTDGQLKEYRWVFKEREVETLLGRLDLNTASVQPEDDANMLCRVLGTTDLMGEDRKDGRSESKLGQIVVNVFRATISTSYVDLGHFSRPRNSDEEEPDMVSSDKDIVHTTRSIATGLHVPNPLRVVDLTRYKPELGSYCTFLFLYRTQKQLARMSLMNIPYSLATPKHKTPHLRSALAKLTPLSIIDSQKRLDSLNTQNIGDSYEEKVRKKLFKSDDKSRIPKRLDYRSSKKERAKEDETTPHNEQYQGECTQNAGHDLRKIAQDRRRLRSKDEPTANGPGECSTLHSVRRSERIRAKANQNFGYPSNSGASADMDSSILGSRNSKTSMNVAGSKEEYREGEIESEGDDNATRDNDLETVADEGDLQDYAPNPEENSEAQRGLRTQVQNMGLEGLGKRSRENFECSKTSGNAETSREIATQGASLGADGEVVALELQVEGGEEEAVESKRAKTTASEEDDSSE